MGPSSAEYERQIADVRGSIESRIVELRERSRDTIRRGRRAILIAAAAGAGLGAATAAAVIVYRMSRPPTLDERLERVLPEGWWKWIRSAGTRLGRGYRKALQPILTYTRERPAAEQPPAGTLERVAIRAARAAGTAMAGAIVTRLLSRAASRRPPESPDPSSPGRPPPGALDAARAQRTL